MFIECNDFVFKNSLLCNSQSKDKDGKVAVKVKKVTAVAIFLQVL